MLHHCNNNVWLQCVSTEFQQELYLRHPHSIAVGMYLNGSIFPDTPLQMTEHTFTHLDNKSNWIKILNTVNNALLNFWQYIQV